MNQPFKSSFIIFFNFILLNLSLGCQTTKLNDQGKKVDKEVQKKTLLNTELMIVRNNLDQKPREAWNNIKNLKRKYPNNPDVLNLLGIVYLNLETLKKQMRPSKIHLRKKSSQNKT